MSARLNGSICLSSLVSSCGMDPIHPEAALSMVTCSRDADYRPTSCPLSTRSSSRAPISEKILAIYHIPTYDASQTCRKGGLNVSGVNAADLSQPRWTLVVICCLESLLAFKQPLYLKWQLYSSSAGLTNGIRGSLLALLVLTVVSRHCSMGSFGFHSAPIWTYQDTGHHAQRPIA